MNARQAKARVRGGSWWMRQAAAADHARAVADYHEDSAGQLARDGGAIPVPNAASPSQDSPTPSRAPASDSLSRPC